MGVRLMSVETNRREQISGKRYTAYVLRVKLTNGQVVRLEHRYSEFAKLRDIFKEHCIHLDAAFPPKHGLLGNWKPALLMWAPDQYEEELAQYRKVQLDVWLVAVATKYNEGDLPHSLARSVHEFLTLLDRPNRDLENTMTSSAFSSLSTSYRQGVGPMPRGTHAPPYLY